MNMKQRFLEAVITGELGQADEFGVIVKLKDFKRYFSDIETDYINSFLPAAVIEPGQHHISHTRYVFRVRKGVYRVHPDAIAEHISAREQQNRVEEIPAGYYVYALSQRVTENRCLIC